MEFLLQNTYFKVFTDSQISVPFITFISNKEIKHTYISLKGSLLSPKISIYDSEPRNWRELTRSLNCL